MQAGDGVEQRSDRVIDRSFLAWRERLAAKFSEIINVYAPRLPATPEALADMMTVMFEGAFIISRTLKEPTAIAERIEVVPLCWTG